MRTLNGRSAQGRTISVVDYAANACHAVHAGDGAGVGRPCALADQGVPTIDGPADIDHEGFVGLVSLDQRFRFEFNPGSARRANLRIPAQLLKLATRIRADRTCVGQTPSADSRPFPVARCEKSTARLKFPAITP